VPHDAFTARVVEQAGAEMLFLGGFGAAASAHGLPDLGLLSSAEMAECVRRITARVSIPLIADGDTGHGNGASVAWTVKQFEAAGAAGILLEDQVEPKRCGHFAGKQVVPVATMLDRLKAALDARRVVEPGGRDEQGRKARRQPRERIERHLGRFWLLMEALDTGKPLPEGWLEAVRREDGLFPRLNAADWATPPGTPATSATAPEPV
jgi:hypothetical protein